MHMADQSDNISEVSYLKAKLIEKERIESFLRAEVSELWSVIKNLERFPLHKIYIKFANFYFNFISIKEIHKEAATSEKFASKESEIELSNFDVLFIVPSDNEEIGGIASSYKLARNLRDFDLNVQVLPIKHDPTSVKSDINIDRYKINETNFDLIVICGSEAANYTVSNKLNLGKKSVMLLQGPDFYFDSEWNNSKNFIDLISSSDLVIALSPYLRKIAEFYGAINIETTPFGLDTSKYFMLSETKEKIIVVPCRNNRDKGTHLVLPVIPKLRELGWKVIGFGELPDIEMAREFDDFVGRLNSEDLGNLFRKSKIILDPSIIEGLGLTALEAAACGCVPIISKRNSYEDLFLPDLIPYVEIPNFLDPKLVIDTVMNIEKNNEYAKYSKNTLVYDWKSGLNNSSKAIKELLNPDKEL